MHKKNQEQFFKLEKDLIKSGWKTPDTYKNHFELLPESSGIYFFLLNSFSAEKIQSHKVLYVGKSINLKQRLCCHEIFRQIETDLIDNLDFIMRWFLPTPLEKIDGLEIFFIKKFNPPYNISHRIRGIL